jgi:hypothetical protein
MQMTAAELAISNSDALGDIALNSPLIVAHVVCRVIASLGSSNNDLKSDSIPSHGSNLKRQRGDASSDFHINNRATSPPSHTFHGVKEHIILHCEMELAWVRQNYWSGKTFVPAHVHLPPYLTFLGSKEFGYVYSQPRTFESSSSNEHPVIASHQSSNISESVSAQENSGH